jgi:hypothetical protein
MAARSSAPEKRPNFFRQLTTLYRFTHEEFSWLPWALGGIVIIVAALGVGVGALIPPFSVWNLVLWGVTGLLLGILLALIMTTRLSNTAMYRKIDGMPGATGHVLSTSLGRSWQASDTPVGVNPRTQEAVYRAVGRGGVVIVGEGARGRLTRLVGEERSKAQRVAGGVPVTVFYVGHGDDDIPIAKLAAAIKKLPKTLDRPTQAAVAKRIESVSQSLASLPIPKGIDPTKARAPRPR